MNKTALKKFAIEARNDLRDKVKTKAFQYGITDESINNKNTVPSNDFFKDGKTALTKEEKDQRNKVIFLMEAKGFNQVIEEVAYTWFNRFTALRFMEIHNYLPSKVRVLSSINEGSVEPDIIREALNVDLNVDKEIIYNLKMSTENDAADKLYKYLILAQCDALSITLPFLFGKTADYTKLLFPDGLLSEGSFFRKMTDTEVLPESDWNQVEIIGWLYQYYIAEKKDEVFKNLKKNVKISKENIPAATQLFTPHWIVRYMVENSLGRIWVESYPETTLKGEWKYYLEEADQEEEVKRQLEEIRYKNVNPEEITFLDPCCGSGHILVYAFEVFYAMYLEKGYVESEIPKLILEKNLYGLDIDDRAAQLASFAVIMKAREKSRRVFRKEIKLNICAIQESNWLFNSSVLGMVDYQDLLIDKNATEIEKQQQRFIIEYIAEVFKDAKEYGSVLDVKKLDLEFLDRRLQELNNEPGDMFEMLAKREILEKLPGLILQAKVMGKKYDVVCTNPPYMSSNSMNKKISDYAKKYYPVSKGDLFAVFIEKCACLLDENGFSSILTMQSWMFLSSYEQLRLKFEQYEIINMAHLGAHAFEEIGGEIVQTVSFVFRKNDLDSYLGKYKRLVDFSNQQEKEKAFLLNNNIYIAQKKNFKLIPTSPIAYWSSSKLVSAFSNGKLLGKLSECKSGLSTTDNNRFLRFWHEISFKNIGMHIKDVSETEELSFKWYPMAKGGNYRKWYGNKEYVVNWQFNGKEIKEVTKGAAGGRIVSSEYYFKYFATWSGIAGSALSVRISDNAIFGSSAKALLSHEQLLSYMAFLNSKITINILELLSPTIGYEAGHIANVPVVFEKRNNHDIESITEDCIRISKSDWDRYETSWDFKIHPLLELLIDTDINAYPSSLDSSQYHLKDVYSRWKEYTEDQFKQLKTNEEEINRIFISIYGLQDELTPEVEDKDVTVRKADQVRDIKSFISYAVGCMFGRYSLDEEGLIFAGGEFDPARYKTFPADKDNVLPIVSDTYFEDDIVSRFIEFVEVTFSKETLDENLNFIAETLGKKAEETDKETIRRYFLNDFYKDHVQTYKKRPIYWMITSGKSKAFNALIYMHRYDKTTLSRVRTDYLHVLQTRMNAQSEKLLSIINGNESEKEKSKAKKVLKTIEKQIEELKDFDEILHHMADKQIEIDLDDGVAVNYMKFKELLVDIKLKASKKK